MADRRFIIEIRSKGFQKAQQNLVQIKRSTDQLAQSTAKASGQTRSFTREQNQAKGAGAAFRRETSALRNNILLYTFAIGGAVAGIGNLVRAFADAQDTTNRFRAVFKELAPEAEAFATEFGDKFGFARTEVMKMMETFQGLFVPLGFSRQAAAGLSEAMVQLSMDVGSFRDVNPTQVAQMFTSALIGNHEAVRRLNIALTENSVKNSALANGFALSKNAVSDQAKVLGRFFEILRQTTDAQGDMSRTMDDFNNRARRVQQQMVGVREQFGEALLPIAEVGLGFAETVGKTEILTGAIAGLITSFVGFKIAAAKSAIAAVGFKAALLGASGLAGIAIGLITALGAIIGALASHYRKSSEAIQDNTRKKRDHNKLIQELIETTNQEAEVLQAVAKRTSELNEVNIKRIKALQTEILLMDQSSALIKAMVSARINENRELTKNEITLLRHIDNLNLEKQAMQQANTQIEERISNLKELQTQATIEGKTLSCYLREVCEEEAKLTKSSYPDYKDK